MGESHLERVREGYEAIARGEIDSATKMLAPDVRWHGAGDGTGGCRNRAQTLAFMRQALADRPAPELLDLQAVGEAVVAVLQPQASGSEERPEPHGEVFTFDPEGLVNAMVVYPTPEEAIAAAQALRP